MELKNVIDKIRVIDGDFPREELELLLANRKEAVPLLIEALDDVYDQWEEAIDEEYFIQIYAM